MLPATPEADATRMEALVQAELCANLPGK